MFGYLDAQKLWSSFRGFGILACGLDGLCLGLLQRADRLQACLYVLKFGSVGCQGELQETRDGLW